MNWRVHTAGLFILSCLISHPTLAEPSPPISALEEARSKVKGWHQKMLEQEALLTQAYEQKDVTTLERESTRLMAKGMSEGVELWRQDAYSPYLTCDTAHIDLGLLAGAMHQALTRPSASTAKILTQERKDYESSKANCERRLSMPGQDAWKDYEAD